MLESIRAGDRRTCHLGLEKGEPLISAARCNGEDFSADHSLGNERIVLQPYVKLLRRDIMREDHAAHVRLEASGQQEHASPDFRGWKLVQS